MNVKTLSLLAELKVRIKYHKLVAETLDPSGVFNKEHHKHRKEAEFLTQCKETIKNLAKQ